MLLFILLLNFFQGAHSDYAVGQYAASTGWGNSELVLAADRTFTLQLHGSWDSAKQVDSKAFQWFYQDEILTLSPKEVLDKHSIAEVYAFREYDGHLYLVPVEHLGEFDSLVASTALDSEESMVRKEKLNSYFHRTLNK